MRSREFDIVQSVVVFTPSLMVHIIPRAITIPGSHADC